METWISEFWGKAQPDKDSLASNIQWHPLAWHMLDVSAVSQALLRKRPRLRVALGAMLGLDDDQLIGFVGFLAALHDTGKYARAFRPSFHYQACPPIPACQKRSYKTGMTQMVWQFGRPGSAIQRSLARFGQACRPGRCCRL
jgi:hypothetical protein